MPEMPFEPGKSGNPAGKLKGHQASGPVLPRAGPPQRGLGERVGSAGIRADPCPFTAVDRSVFAGRRNVDNSGSAS